MPDVNGAWAWYAGHLHLPVIWVQSSRYELVYALASHKGCAVPNMLPVLSPHGIYGYYKGLVGVTTMPPLVSPPLQTATLELLGS